MRDPAPRYTGGCLCGALRYEAQGEPLFMGYCYRTDCQKASGSGFIPFMGFLSAQVRFSGEVRQFRSPSWRGRVAVRNCCSSCNSLVFGGEVGKSEQFTVYAGSLDDPTLFKPRMAIFARSRPSWAVIPTNLATYDTLPPHPGGR